MEDRLAWLERRALNGDHWSLFFLGDAYYQSGKSNLPRSKPPHWVPRSARTAWTHKNALVGDMRFEGDTCKGVELLSQAADLGNTRAMIAIGSAYAQGECVTKDCKKAAALFERAASEGDPGGWVHLGTLSANGCQRPVDRALAESLYLKGAEAGDALGMYNLAGCFRSRGDNATAFKWMERAAALGHGLATNNLGYMYDKGLGTKPDSFKACMLYHSAVELGCNLAIANRDACMSSIPRK